MRFLGVLVVLVGAVAFSGCEKPGASHVTSPSALSLLGTTAGAVEFGVADAPPVAAAAQPGGWDFVLENARFAELDDGTHSIQVVNTVVSDPGLEMEIWISDSTGTLAVWSGGETDDYSGTVCFQLRLEDGDAGLAISGSDPVMTIAFVDPESGDVEVVDAIGITGNAPAAAYESPEGSDVLVNLLGCPRSVI